jgi:hypothetical protein
VFYQPGYNAVYSVGSQLTLRRIRWQAQAFLLLVLCWFLGFYPSTLKTEAIFPPKRRLTFSGLQYLTSDLYNHDCENLKSYILWNICLTSPPKLYFSTLCKGYRFRGPGSISGAARFFLSSGSGTGSTQPRDDNRGAISRK